MSPREHEAGEPRTAGAGTGADPRTAGAAGAAGITGSGPAQRPLPAPGMAEVRIVAASAEAARRIAQVLRFRFAATEQRGAATGDAVDESDGGTRLHLTVDTVHFPDATGPFQLRLVGGESHTREITGVAGVTEAVADGADDADDGGEVGAEPTDAPPRTRPRRPERPAPNTRLAKPPTTPDEPGDRPTS